MGIGDGGHDGAREQGSEGAREQRDSRFEPQVFMITLSESELPYSPRHHV